MFSKYKCLLRLGGCKLNLLIIMLVGPTSIFSAWAYAPWFTLGLRTNTTALIGSRTSQEFGLHTRTFHNFARNRSCYIRLTLIKCKKPRRQMKWSIFIRNVKFDIFVYILSRYDFPFYTKQKRQKMFFYVLKAFHLPSALPTSSQLISTWQFYWNMETHSWTLICQMLCFW